MSDSTGLDRLLRDAVAGNAFYSRKLAGIALPCPLERLPFTTRDELLAAQAESPPHGGLISVPFSSCTRMHQTSGTSSGVPLRWYDTPESWAGLLDVWLELFAIAGLTGQDVFFFPFSFGPFLGFWSAFEAGQRLGCRVLPGGGMSSSARLRFLIDNVATVVFCTPTYALRLAEVAGQESINLAGSAVRAVVVAGEPGGSLPGTRARIEAAWGARVFDHNGMTETGPLGIECVEARGGLHLLETAAVPEVIDPVTLAPVLPGVEGELVVTTFRRADSPLIRYRTGDLVRIDPSSCPCGRAFLRLDGGIRGRLDETVAVRGNNLHPAAFQGFMHAFPGVAEYLVEIDQTGTMAEVRLRVESPEGPAIVSRLERALRDWLHFRVDVALADPGTLPRGEMKSRRWVRKSRTGAAPERPDA
jgi:phenylacetate-CoA ligase